MKMSTSRSNFVLKTNVTEYDSRIPQNRLPSEEQVLRAFLYFNEKSLEDSLPGQHKSVNWASAKSTLDLIKHVYAKACIPMLSDDGVCKKILKLYNEYKSFNKIPEQRRSQLTVKKRVEDFQLRLPQSTLACWDPNAKLQREDEEFLENMKTQRTFTIGGLDTKRQKMIQRRNKKVKRQEEFRKRALEETETMQKAAVLFDYSEIVAIAKMRAVIEKEAALITHEIVLVTGVEVRYGTVR